MTVIPESQPGSRVNSSGFTCGSSKGNIYPVTSGHPGAVDALLNLSVVYRMHHDALKHKWPPRSFRNSYFIQVAEFNPIVFRLVEP